MSITFLKYSVNIFYVIFVNSEKRNVDTFIFPIYNYFNGHGGYIIMFNEKQKMEYLDYYDGDIKNLKYLFTHTREFEEKHGKDISLIDNLTALEYFKGYDNIRTACSDRARLERYSEWCRAKGYCRKNYFDKRLMSNKDIKALFNVKNDRYYITPETYNEYCHKIKEYYNGDYVISMFMAVYESLAGRNYENIPFISLDNIDIANNTVTVNGQKYYVTRELVQCLLITGNMTKIPNKTLARDLDFYFTHNAVFKFVEELKLDNVKYRMNRYFREIKEVVNDQKISQGNLYYSGIFNGILEYADKKGLHLKEDIEQRTNYSLYQEFFDMHNLKSDFAMFRLDFRDYFNYL